MATINLGRVKPVFRGAYNASTAYVIDDIVTYQNETYIAITATTGNLPTVTANWTLMAEGGDVASTLTTQGDILYRDASGLARLGAGTSGQFLKTQGTGANPVWGTVSTGLVGFATAVQPNTTYINSTSFVSWGLSLNYTPVDGANNKIIVLLNGGYGQDDTDGQNSIIRVRQTANTAYDVVQDFFGVDQSGGQVFNVISIFKQDTQVTDNTQLTYEVFGRVESNSASDIRPHNYTTLSVMEIGV